MLESRRRLLTTSLLGLTGVFAVPPLLRTGLQTPQPLPSPHAPNPNFPPGLNGPDTSPPPNKKAVDQQNQKEIRAEVEKLYELASDLKEQVGKTDATSVLSLSVVKQAQQIEKLAKQIKERAKG